MSTPQKFLLWDVPTRLFHWSLALLILLQWGTAEWHWLDMDWHFRFGYATLALLLFRLLWGFLGSDSARFSGFLRGPGAVFAYLRTLHRREPEFLAGHNPVGGWSVVALLACVAVQAVTGLFSGEEDEALYGPLAGWLGDDAIDAITDVHEANKNVLLALIVVHVLGVLWHLFVKRENLVRAMLGGRATLREDPKLRFAGLWLAIVLAILCGFAVWALVAYGAR
ncbi:MAG TPA: cytochrome b/b6 domain-containing protein [Xanthomonadales bacterium]|nr:cytochrome b/b6 domain-containing protein [Xanthomonadales bacterium]